MLGFIGDILGINADSRANKANMHMQYDFAQKGLQWKVEDAKKAGIHPLYALGASTQTPSFKIGSQGDNIRNMADKLANKELQNLQKKNIAADIALKMARASESARRAQNMNSQQDADIVGLDLVKPNDIVSKARGKNVRTPLGHKFKIGTDTPVQLFEEEYGQVASELYGFQRYLKDRNFFGSKELGSKFYKLMKAASSRGVKSKKAKMAYKANRLLFGKYFADYMRERNKRFNQNRGK